MTEVLQVPEPAARPRHVAIIMDGNGRWAQDRGLGRLEGHRRGASVVRDITTFARELGLEYLTLYSFSVQNWRRPPLEVAGLMGLLQDYCTQELPTLMKNEIRLSVIGELSRLPARTRSAVNHVMSETRRHRKMRLTLALDYGGREELVKAAQRLALEVQAGKLAPEKIDEEMVSASLDTHDVPDPDLVIRTSGERRISNFLLWQVAYSELFFTDVRWPDFTRTDFAAALLDYSRRDRRFGAIAEAEAAAVNGRAEVGSEEPVRAASSLAAARGKGG